MLYFITLTIRKKNLLVEKYIFSLGREDLQTLNLISNLIPVESVFKILRSGKYLHTSFFHDFCYAH